MPTRRARAILSLLLAAVAPLPLSSQVAVATHEVNLRPDASSHNTPLRALSAGERVAILDGNVRRVLARFFLVDGVSSERWVERKLWGLAEVCTPARGVALYTQAIMDLGATVCVRHKPLCTVCPLAADCGARQSGRQHQLPTPRVRAARPQRAVVMLLAQRGDGSVLLERRAEQGIWGGLWCPPQFSDAAAAAVFAGTRLEAATVAAEPLALVHHAFTHFELAITPLRALCKGYAGVMDGSRSLWYNAANPQRLGLPAPVATLIQNLR